MIPCYYKEDDLYLNLMKERVLENVFKGDNMTGGQTEKTEASQKAFESITKTLTKCKEKAKQLSVRSRKLVSLLTGQSEPKVGYLEKDKEEKLKVDSVVLIYVLRDIEEELCISLSEISNSLDSLEKAW